MKLYVDSSERYPFWELRAVPDPATINPARSALELTDAEAADYQQVMERFQRWQERIESEWEKDGRQF